MNKYAEMIKNLVPMRVLADRLGMAVNRGGYICCPFHGEKTASLRIYAGAGGWHCFGCGMGGSVIDFCMAYYSIDFRQAMVRLDTEFGLGLPLTERESLQEQAQARKAAISALKERETIQRERECVEADYWSAFRLYQMVDRIVLDQRPKGPDDPIAESYARALMLLPELRDSYEHAQERWWECAGVSSRGRYLPVQQGRLPEKLRAV